MTDYSYLCSLREIYILDGLGEAAVRRFERHVCYCEDCLQEMRILSTITEGMLYDFESVHPPSGMRERIFNHIFCE